MSREYMVTNLCPTMMKQENYSKKDNPKDFILCLQLQAKRQSCKSGERDNFFSREEKFSWQEEAYISFLVKRKNLKIKIKNPTLILIKDELKIVLYYKKSNFQKGKMVEETEM